MERGETSLIVSTVSKLLQVFPGGSRYPASSHLQLQQVGRCCNEQCCELQWRPSASETAYVKRIYVGRNMNRSSRSRMHAS